MKIIVSVLFIIFSLFLLLVGGLAVSPYYFYSKILKNDYYGRWYSLTNYSHSILTPSESMIVNYEKLGNVDLWKQFHFMDVLVPLPVRNPFYYVSPVLKYIEETKKTEIGLKIYDAKEREISKIYFTSNRLFPNELNSQKFFQLPLVKKHLKMINQEQIWKDLFSKQLKDWNVPFAEMAYNLYLLHLRSKLLPEKYLQYALVANTLTGVIELESLNKDYITEFILTKNQGIIYSFVLITEKGNEESQLIRSKLLNETQFQGGSEHLTNILYREFKGLSYDAQIDHEGMLYLLSAWTHSPDNQDFLKEMIFNLERGERNQRQLEPIYKYAYERYGKTFSTKDIAGIKLDDNIILQRNVELEKQRDEEKLKNQRVEIEEIQISPEEEMRLRLEEAKRNQIRRRGRQIID
jgi:hypothetical protein